MAGPIKMLRGFLHSLIKYSLEYLHYYEASLMSFTARNYTPGWHSFEVGIPMGYASYPILFAMAIKIKCDLQGSMVEEGKVQQARFYLQYVPS